MNKNNLKDLFREIGLTEAEGSVYLALLDGAVSVQEIIRTTGEKRPTVYYSLSALERRGLVSKSGRQYGSKFQLEPIERLDEVVSRNIRKQTDLLEKVKVLHEYYPTKKSEEKVLVSYFDDFESIKSTIFLSLYAKEKHLRTIVPAQNFFHELGREFVKEYVSEKRKRKVKTTALWEDIPNKKILKEYYDDSEIRQLPIDMHNSFDTTIMIYDNKTLYVSPKKDSSAVLIQSDAHTKMTLTMFDYTWKNAIPVF